MSEIGYGEQVEYYMIDKAAWDALIASIGQNNVYSDLYSDFLYTHSDPKYKDYYFAPKGAIDFGEIDWLADNGIRLGSEFFRLSNQPSILAT